MAYSMFCDHCRTVLKVDNDNIKPFSVIEITGPTINHPVKLRYCEDCTKEVLDDAEANREVITKGVYDVSQKPVD